MGSWPGMDGSCRPILPVSARPVLYLECEEEPLSLAQMNHLENKKKKFKAQMKELKKLSLKASSMSVNAESAIINIPEKVSELPLSKSVVPPTAMTQMDKYRLIMDPATGRIIGSFNDTPNRPQLSGIPHFNQPTAVPFNINVMTPQFRAPPPTVVHATKTARVPVMSLPRPPKHKKNMPPQVKASPLQKTSPLIYPQLPKTPIAQQTLKSTIQQQQKTAPPKLQPRTAPPKPQPRTAPPKPQQKMAPPKPQQKMAPPKPQQKTAPPPLFNINSPVSLNKPIPPPLLPLTPSVSNGPPKPPTAPGSTPESPAKSEKVIVPTTLSVVPKSLRIIPQYHAAVVRKRLDSKVKGLLVRNPSKFTEFLIRQGLIPTSQFSVDKATGEKKDLKLGIYSDEKKFPRSGGYVWINKDEPSVFYSVFDGSIFNDSELSPVTILKLLYHWSCQTNVQNILQWVKVDIGKLDRYFRIFRCVCTLFESSSAKKIGGPNKKVQIGIISLGTMSNFGVRKEVKVEVLGALEVETGKIRLKALVPSPEISQAKRFGCMFKSLPGWIHSNSTILADFSIEKSEIVKLGFKDVQQNHPKTKKTAEGNSIIMDYLKRIVPKMFQSNLSKLSSTEVQPFLDELSFRETAYHPLLCFESMVRHIAELTQSMNESSKSIFKFLEEVEKDPFTTRLTSIEDEDETKTDETESDVDEPTPQPSAPKTSTKRPADSEVASQQQSKKFKYDTVDLQTYFYGSIPGSKKILSDEFKADMAFKCHICRKIYFNNLDFMKHLSLHADNDRASAVDLLDLSQCNYCTMNFETPEELKSHVDTTHLKANMEFVCQICMEDFQWESHLVNHIAKFHIRGELPYSCRFCGARSSNHVELINHFHAEHDRSDKIQCPECLKDYSLMGEKGYTSSIASAFVAHLQSHMGPAKSFPCKFCSLSFLQEAYLKNHVSRDHSSFYDFDNFQPYVYAEGESPISMDRPKEKPSRVAPKKAVLVKPQTQIAFASQNLEDMVMYNVYKEDCCECDKKMTNPGHFHAYLCCTLCRYSTCCSKAISIHYSLFHGQSKPMYTLGTPCILENKIYCVCGFKTNSGNKMAKHMGTHNCRSAYPSRKAARAAKKVVEVVGSRIDLDDTASETDSVTPMNVDEESTKKDEEKQEPPTTNDTGEPEVTIMNEEKEEEEEVQCLNDDLPKADEIPSVPVECV